ncbi:uncharacterized protein LOC125570122 [Nematostella vectensis]|uniref:uncharacterized protein LOC125570122 n=1 Tax=Nematostella vectensis TaxID=45351 RepID=UPI00207729C2|nr:uncharacterized protein LOC125570122 [Nematostella vectensis]
MTKSAIIALSFVLVCLVAIPGNGSMDEDGEIEKIAEHSIDNVEKRNGRDGKRLESSQRQWRRNFKEAMNGERRSKVEKDWYKKAKIARTDQINMERFNKMPSGPNVRSISLVESRLYLKERRLRDKVTSECDRELARHRRGLRSGANVNRTSTPMTANQSATVTSQPQTTPAPPPPPPPLFINCTGIHSCRGRCTAGMDYGRKDELNECRCDPYCTSFKDCCADFDTFCPEVARGRPLFPPLQWYECVSNFRVYDIWMITVCPWNSTEKSVSQKCMSNEKMTSQNYDSVIPVTTAEGKTFKNRHCAACHGVKTSDMRFYGLDMNCELSPPEGFSRTETIKFLLEYCSYVTWKPTDSQPRRRCYDIKNPCENKFSEYRDLFHVFPLSVVWHDRVNYRNIYCAACEMVDTNSPPLLCGPLPRGDTMTGPSKPFSIVMNIGDDQDPNPKFQKVKIECDIDEVYDPYLEMCRKAAFVPDSIPGSSRFDEFRVALWVTRLSKNSVPISFLSHVLIIGSLAETFGLNVTTIGNLAREIIRDIDVNIFVFDVTVEDNSTAKRRKRSMSRTFDDLVQFKEPIEWLIDNETFTILKATVRRLSCVNVEHYPPGEYTVTPTGEVYVNKTGDTFNKKDFYSNETSEKSGISHKVPVGTVVVCRKRLATSDNCTGSYIFIESYEYVILSNKSLFHNATRRVYQFDQYTVNENKTATICSNFTDKSYTKKQRIEIGGSSNVKLALTVLTYVGLILSVACLLVVVVTYSLFSELRTAPGVNLLNLSISILLAQFLFLVGSGQTGSKAGCVFIAIVLHYAFLASFSWMLIIAFDTWRAFSFSGQSAMRSDKAKQRQRIMKRLAIGYLSVFVLVIILTALDQSGAFAIRYGGSKGCWINNGDANLYIFVIPVSLALVWNAVFFVLTVKAIRVAKQQSRAAVNEGDQKRDIAVYAKIASLMGFAWVFGILAAFISEYLMFPFVIFTTAQGVFIAVSFVFTRRVWKLYAQKFSSDAHSRSLHKEQGRSNAAFTPSKTKITETQF